MIGGLRKKAARAAERITLRQVHRSGSLSIQASRAGGEEAVIVFGSLQGNLAAREEMVGSATAGGARGAFFVRDLSGGWYQDARDAEIIRARLRGELDAMGARRVMCVGDSMGAYAALAFARDLGATSALAFGPQYDADPAGVPEEIRWPEERAAIPDFGLGPLGPLLGAETSYFVLHGREGADIVHWSRFPVQANLHHYLLGGRWHDVARWMKGAGCLGRCFELAFAGDATGFDAFMAEIGGRRRRPDESFETTPNDWFQTEFPARAADRAGADLKGAHP